MIGRYSDLRKKWVINRTNGNILGRVTDLEVELTRNRVLSIVTGQRKHWWFLLGATDETAIPWQQIEVIGEDTILVRIDPRPATGTEQEKENR